MKKKVLAIILTSLLLVALIAGCTENYKQDAVSTPGATTPVRSNGGLAVQAGEYVYFINGYSDNTPDNTFGNVLKGAIVRSTLKDGMPDPKTNVVVVPKIVYNSVATSGLYIAGGYLYYSSPNTEKNKDGVAKSTEMTLMRTKLDGTGTQIIKTFSDYTAPYTVSEKGILYYLSNELHYIDVNSKKFDDKVVAEGISANYFVPHADDENGFAGTAFFTKTASGLNQSHQIVYAYRAGDAAPKEVINGLTSYAAPLHVKGYTFTLVSSNYVGDKLRLVYRKSDGGSNTISAGTYSYDFDANLAFDETKEERYVVGTTVQYSAFLFLQDGVAVATTADKTVMLTKQPDGSWNTDTIKESAVTMVKVEEKEGRAYLTYVDGSKYYRIPFADVTGQGAEKQYAFNVSDNTVCLFSTSYHSTWLQPDCIGDVLYFFHSGVKNYTYVLNLANVIERDAESMTPTLLSTVTKADQIELLTA